MIKQIKFPSSLNDGSNMLHKSSLSLLALIVDRSLNRINDFFSASISFTINGSTVMFETVEFDLGG